jgi:hypothetical protein
MQVIGEPRDSIGSLSARRKVDSLEWIRGKIEKLGRLLISKVSRPRAAQKLERFRVDSGVKHGTVV